MDNQSLGQKIKLYLEASAGGIGFYLLEECLTLLVGWAPTLAGVMLRSVIYRILIKGRGRFMMENRVRIRGMRFIEIDENVYIDQGVYLHGRPGGLRICANTRLMQGVILHGYNFRDLAGSGIIIGKNCVISINTIITGQGRVVLEDDVIIGPGAMILPVDHVFQDSSRPIREQGIQSKGITIKKGSWIGAGAIVLDGVTIGQGAVVAAASVVNRDVSPFTLVAGNPAQPIKQWGAI